MAPHSPPASDNHTPRQGPPDKGSLGLGLSASAPHGAGDLCGTDPVTHLEVVQRETADVDRASNEDVTNEDKSERRLSGGELFAEVLEMKWRRL